MILTVMVGSRTFAQDFFSSVKIIGQRQVRPEEVIHDNEYTRTGLEQGKFYDNPLMLNGRPLIYTEFNEELKGELTVVKGAAGDGHETQVPFYVYLRREGKKVLTPVNNVCHAGQTRFELSQILRYAKPGDQLVIEAVNKEDGLVKRILKIPGGC
jgi:hypothetical protein